MSSEQSKLNSRELAVLESLPEKPRTISQREIARHTGLSVGLINSVLKKLVTTGFVKATRLNRRTIEYLLTPQGFTEKALKSYYYVLSVVRNYQTIRSRLQLLIDRHLKDGCEVFYLYGEGELAEIVTSFFSETNVPSLIRGLPDKGVVGVVVLNSHPSPMEIKNVLVVDLVRELGNGGGQG